MKHVKQTTDQILTGNLPTHFTPSKTFDISEYAKGATVYFFSRLKLIYLSKFTQSFQTEDSIKLARREWANEIGGLSKDQIDNGLDQVKKYCADHNKDFEWPNVALAIGVCRGAYKDVDGSERQRLGTIKEAYDRTIARKFRLTDNGAKDRAKEARNKIMEGLKAKLAV